MVLETACLNTWSAAAMRERCVSGWPWKRHPQMDRGAQPPRPNRWKTGDEAAVIMPRHVLPRALLHQPHGGIRSPGRDQATQADLMERKGVEQAGVVDAGEQLVGLPHHPVEELAVAQCAGSSGEERQDGGS